MPFNKQPGDESPPASPCALTSVNSHDENSSRGTEAPKVEPRIPTREACLERLYALSGLVVLGVVPPGRANAARGCYQSILNSLSKTSNNGEETVGDENVLKALKANPELLDLLKPLLSDQQINLVLRGFRDDE